MHKRYRTTTKYVYQHDCTVNIMLRHLHRQEWILSKKMYFLKKKYSFSSVFFILYRSFSYDDIKISFSPNALSLPNFGFVFFFLLYADHRKYTKIRCQKSRSENERCENDLYVLSHTTNT